MNKIKNILTLIIFAVLIYSCGDDNVGVVNPFDGVDYEALAISDNDSIVQFLKTHYYNPTLDSIKLIESSQTSIFEEAELVSTSISNNDINYTLYTFIANKGVSNNPIKISPSVIDSVFTNYTGTQLLSNTINRNPFDSGQQAWLTNTITGWANGFTNFIPGENITNNGPITYQNTGKGYIFIPGGLAYPSSTYQLGQNPNARPYDQILVFKIELLDFVVDTDHDNDGKPSIEEDANGDGDPRNDFSDENNPTLPDYLNPTIN